MKKTVSFLSLFLISLLLSAVSAKVVNGYVNVKERSSGLITFKITSVDYRDDVTRLKGTLSGRPHTSNRLDTLILVTPQGKSYTSTDIEGVDMKRYFQWEDDGEIEVEIDFAPMKPLSSFELKATGPNGPSSSLIKLVKAKKGNITK